MSPRAEKNHTHSIFSGNCRPNDNHSNDRAGNDTDQSVSLVFNKKKRLLQKTQAEQQAQAYFVGYGKLKAFDLRDW